MANVTLEQAGDAVAVRWREDGKVRVAKTDGELKRAYRLAVAEGLARGDAAVMDGTEREVALDLSERAGVRKDSGNGLIVAYYPYDGTGGDGDALATALSAFGGGRVAREDIHLTLCYLGQVEQYDLDLVAAVVKLVSYWWWGADCRIAGTGRFVVGPDEDAHVVLVDSSELQYLRSAILDELCCYTSMNYDAVYSHGYVPHFTVGYSPRSGPSLPGLEDDLQFRVNALSVAAGSARHRFDLGGPGADSAREELEPYFAARHAVNVAKAGRVLSGQNLRALQDAHDMMGVVIAAEVERRKGEDPEEETTKALAAAPGLEYAVTKADEEKMYTFGPLYAPNRKDAHGEWTDADTLQQAVWDYVQDCVDKGSNRLKLQHGQFGEGVTVGHWVDVCAWPYETTIKVAVPGEDPRDLVMPAGTVYMGVKWDVDAWDAVKSRQLTGLSLGGKALRVAEGDLSEMDHMGDKLAAKKHDYVGKADTCEKCGKSYEEGSHNTISKGAPAPAPEHSGPVPVPVGTGGGRIMSLAAEMMRAEEERAMEDRSLLGQALEALKGVAGRQVGDVHVHVPEQRIDVNVSADVKPADVKLDVVE